MPKGFRADGKPSPLLGRPRPQEVIDKFKAAWTPEKKAERSEQYSGEGNPHFGKTHNEETKQRISIITKEKMTPEICAYLSKLSKARTGELSSNWRGGRWVYWQYPYEFEAIKPYIRERDDYTCQHCGATNNITNGRNLDVHHRDGNRFNNNEDNLITLCRSCHKIAEAKLRAEKEVSFYDGDKIN